MTAQWLDGKRLAQTMQTALQASIAKLGSRPTLAALLVGEDPSAAAYIKSQARLAQSLGLTWLSQSLPSTATQQQAEAQIDAWNRDRSVHAIFIQTPLPKGIDAPRLISHLDPLKDVEGLAPKSPLLPCTALAAIALIESTGEPLRGKEAVVVGKSVIVGRPVCMLLLDRGATTTVCHTGTAERGLLAAHVQRAEILVAAAGKPGLIQGEWIREGAIVIDVGTTMVGDKLVGDVAFDAAAKRAKYITPVPGGVGPVTTMMLMQNVVAAYKLQRDGA